MKLQQLTKKYMRRQFTILLILTFVLGLVPTNFSEAAGLATRLKGKILLQVESKGEAWYINPVNEKRYYLGRPADAFQVMRELGLGISNKDFDSFRGYAPSRLSGKILLKVEDSGKAYYVNPIDLKMHYLGKPADAFQIMRELGLGITNNDLGTILENGQIDTSNLKVLTNAEIIDQLKDSVVYVETSDGAGSGFVLESTGYILTNAHVVQGISTASVILSDNSTFNASVVGRDENIDLALLKINKSGIKKVVLGDSSGTKQGDEIFTLGYPFGIKGEVSFKEGTVSRTIKDSNKEYIETSADIHPGNSGGPLINRYGQVVGINTAVFGENVQGVSVGETIKLAIPINVAKNILDDLKNGRNIVNKVPIIDKKIEKPEPITCNGNISELAFVESGTYHLYDLYNLTQLDIFPGSNEMKIVGVVKNNNPTCRAYNIKAKVTVQGGTSTTQEETVILNKNSSALTNTKLILNPGNSGEYKLKINVFEMFIDNVYGLGSVIKKNLKTGVTANTQIVGADWLPVQ